MKKGVLIIIVVILGLLVVAYFMTDIFQDSDVPETIVIYDTTIVKEDVLVLYGIPADSFNIVTAKVEKDQNLTKILLKYGIGYLQIDQIVRRWASVFDVRKIRAGHCYSVFCSKDSTACAKYFVYEQDPIEYIVFDFSDSVRLYREKKEILSVRRTSSGLINSSLWNSMTDNNINPVLSIELSEIYAWSIDFFGLQKGDHFKVLYEEQYVDNQSIGIGAIFGACFTHIDSAYYAIPFEQDSVRSYYDIQGNSLRKAFLKAPLKFSRISSKFSNCRLHPVLKIRRPHHGVDYAAPVGTPVMAIGGGKVTKAGRSGGAGNMVKIKHNSMYETAYLHLSKYGVGIKVGKLVKQGDVIGYVGSSGISTGPHLDFRFYKNGTAIDPLTVDAPPVEPVKAELKAEYDSISKIISLLLDEAE